LDPLSGRYEPCPADKSFVDTVYITSIVAGEDVPWTEAASNYRDLKRKWLAFKRAFNARWRADKSVNPKGIIAFDLKSVRRRWLIASLLMRMLRVSIVAVPADVAKSMREFSDDGKVPLCSYLIKNGPGSWEAVAKKSKIPVRVLASKDDIVSSVRAIIAPGWARQMLRDLFTEIALCMNPQRIEESKLKARFTVAICGEGKAEALCTVASKAVIDMFYLKKLDENLRSDRRETEFDIGVRLTTHSAILDLLSWPRSAADSQAVTPVISVVVTRVQSELIQAASRAIAHAHNRKSGLHGCGNAFTPTEHQMNLYRYKAGWILCTAENPHPRMPLTDEERMTVIMFARKLESNNRESLSEGQRVDIEMRESIKGVTK